MPVHHWTSPLPQLSDEQIMVIAGIPREEIRHTRAIEDWLVQDWLAEGRQERRHEGEAAVTLRLLNRRCDPLIEATTAQIQAMPLDQLESLADALSPVSASSGAWRSALRM